VPNVHIKAFECDGDDVTSIKRDGAEGKDGRGGSGGGEGKQAWGNAEEGGEPDGTERGVGVGGDVPEVSGVREA
jgi:hypothetical protein